MSEADGSQPQSTSQSANGATPPNTVSPDTVQANAAQAAPAQAAGQNPSGAPKRSRRSSWQRSPGQPVPVNSIEVASSPSRDRAKPRDPATPKVTPQNQATPQGTSSRAENRPAASASDPGPAVPEHIRERYIQVGRRFHFPDGDPAFQIRLTRTTTRSENPQVIRDMLEIERARAGGAPLLIRGSEKFRAEAWMQAQLMGIETRGYRPSEVERAQLVRTIAKEKNRAQEMMRGPNSSQGLADGPDRDEPAPQPVPAQPVSAQPSPAQAVPAATTARTAVPERERGTPNEGSVYRGRLIEHGTANYRHDRHAEMSYYVKLETRDGERVLWGKDFERAIQQSLSQVKIGDEVSIQHAGERPVTVTRRRQDEEGRFVRKEEVAAYRNRWIVETRNFLREREEVARLVRDPTVDPQEAVKKHPKLVGTYLELQAAKLVAQERYPHEDDRKRFVTRIREALADEIARGEALSVPQVRNPGPRQSTRESPHKSEHRQPLERVQAHVRA